MAHDRVEHLEVACHSVGQNGQSKRQAPCRWGRGCRVKLFVSYTESALDDAQKMLPLLLVEAPGTPAVKRAEPLVDLLCGVFAHTRLCALHWQQNEVLVAISEAKERENFDHTPQPLHKGRARAHEKRAASGEPDGQARELRLDVPALLDGCFI